MAELGHCLSPSRGLFPVIPLKETLSHTLHPSREEFLPLSYPIPSLGRALSPEHRLDVSVCRSLPTGGDTAVPHQHSTRKDWVLLHELQGSLPSSFAQFLLHGAGGWALVTRTWRCHPGHGAVTRTRSCHPAQLLPVPSQLIPLPRRGIPASRANISWENDPSHP